MYMCVCMYFQNISDCDVVDSPGIDEATSTTCKTEKSKQKSFKHKTAGICAAVFNCGIVTGITELHGCESLSQVYIFLIWLWHTLILFPKLLAYDDGCHLKKFVMNPIRKSKTLASKLLSDLTIVVDKMHFKNHTDKWCRLNVNPNKVEAFKNLNTEACKQTFSFISKFKHATKHMNYGHYNLFHLTMCNIFNEDRLVRKKKRTRHCR
jgi:hypothetical protein